jgi:hypothetical protein
MDVRSEIRRHPRLGFALVATTTLLLAGCPLYSDRYYYDDAVANPPALPQGTCAIASDCSPGFTCGRDGRCTTAACDTVGCSNGFVCSVSAGMASCVKPLVPDAGPPTPPFSGCRKTSDCSDAGANAKCLSGVCTATADQCSDATQCHSGQLCVEGTCTASCSATRTCPIGFACDEPKGVCSKNPGSCSASTACRDSSTTCVQERCVPRCGTNSMCAADLICVDGGCIPDERPVFSCSTDGERGTGKSGSCAFGSICLRKSCYIACDPAAADACVSADTFNSCKSVTTVSGPHNVCGSSKTLGSECDVAMNRSCAGGLVCIDGYCR